MVDNVTVTREELLPCPFCAQPLAIRGGRNPYGRCDTAGCWVNERKAVVVMDDPAQVAAWNTRLSPAPEGVDARELLASAMDAAGFTQVAYNLAHPETAEPDGYLRAALSAVETALSRPPAEQVRMREALEPFARLANQYDPPEGDDSMPLMRHDGDELNLGHLRDARAALTPPPKGQNDHG